NNQISELPEVIGQLKNLQSLSLDENPLIPELAAAYSQGTKVLLAYLQARDAAPITLNETKLILVGEGEVGKTSLLASLRGEKFIEKRATTHGVEVDVKSLVVANPGTNTEISLNGWDFGGQNIYRHTHQLFFTAPAVYLAVWEPRRGPEQCRVQEWIKMIKHRAYDETRPAEKPRILVVATHGGPKERLAHIDEQALKDEFGELIRGFYHVDSKPGPDGVCYNLETLKTAIAAEAAAIPSVGRTVPQSWKEVLEAVRARSEKEPYIYFSDFESICEEKGVSKSLAETYAIIMNELGHLIYFRDDEILKNTVILKPDYLSKAVSFILEDDQTRNAHGLIEHPRLGTLWNNPDRPAGERYPAHLHPIFLRLMNRFDLSYQVSMPQAESPPTSLMAQLVPSIRPEGWQEAWGQNTGDAERTQVCRILDATTGRTVEAEGLMYRLIVRLHRYSLGRDNYHLSRHWKTGMVLDDGYNGRAFIEEIDGDIYVNVRAAYPERFLAHLCAEVQWLVEHFWKGLDARLYVPCPGESCKGLLELGEIMDFKSNGIPKVRCGVCRQFHDIDGLMTSQKPRPDWQEAMMELREGQREILQAHQVGFDQLSTQLKVLMSQADEQYAKLLAWLSDPAKDGPRLFSLLPVTRSKFNPREWTSEKFHLLLWCEHSKLPVSFWHGPKSRQGIIEIELKRDWFERAAPFLKVLTSTLSLVLPVASATVKLSMADEDYKSISNQLEFTQKFIDSSLKGAEKFNEWLDRGDNFSRPNEPEEVDDLTPAGGSALRELHALLREKDPGFG
ncbi:MAG TPA: COR domain-containing protein, partial [Calditrichia bacterium]|nr:COR domain-containing protein [Calditrichia bacterium]